MGERTDLTKFVIQSASGLFPEVDILKHVIHDTIRQRAWSVSYEQVEFEKFKRRIQTNDDRYVDHYPVGSIQFVEYWLNHYHNKSMQPIEVPQALRTEEFLKRDYKIITKNEVPHTGRYFVKSVSKLKSGSFLGDMIRWHTAYASDYDDDTVFSLSSELDILSEWRVYYIDGKIENISNYDGDPLVFPDVKLINKMIGVFEQTEKTPKSYSIDVAVTNEGTAILEIHPFASIGLYNTLWGTNLIEAYKDGIEWYKSTNYKLF